MAEKMTKPAIRFAGFTDAWEQRKLGEIADFNPKASLPEIFEYVDLESVVGTEMIDHRTESKETAPSRAQRLAQEGDLFYQTVRPYQRNNFLLESADNTYVFSTGYAQMRPHIDGHFLLSFVQTDMLVTKVLDRCTGTSYPAINANDLADMEVRVPVSRKEQEHIGAFFHNLDHLITLHQRKYDKLVCVKKAMLEKMFPKNGASKPEIRFAGFTDAWEQRKVGELASVSMNRRVFKEQTSEIGDVPFFKIGTFGGIPDAYISRELFEEYRAKYPYPKVGDILISASGSIGRTVEYSGKDEYFQDSNIVWLNHDERIDNSFLKCFYSVVRWAGIEGSTIKRLYNDNILSTEICFPSVSEQQRIGVFFCSLDHLITLHQRELEKLKNLKKALLEKMFV